MRRGNPGNKGGRLPRVIQRKALRMVAERMDLLGHIADGSMVAWSEDKKGRRVPTLTSPSAAERLKSMQLLHDIAMSGKKVAMLEVRKRLNAQIAVIRETLPPDQAESLLGALEQVWA